MFVRPVTTLISRITPSVFGTCLFDHRTLSILNTFMVFICQPAKYVQLFGTAIRPSGPVFVVCPQSGVLQSCHHSGYPSVLGADFLSLRGASVCLPNRRCYKSWEWGGAFAGKPACAWGPPGLLGLPWPPPFLSRLIVWVFAAFQRVHLELVFLS